MYTINKYFQILFSGFTLVFIFLLLKYFAKFVDSYKGIILNKFLGSFYFLTPGLLTKSSI